MGISVFKGGLLYSVLAKMYATKGGREWVPSGPSSKLLTRGQRNIGFGGGSIMRAYCKTEGFKKRIQKVSVSPWPSWVLSPPDTFTFDALGLRAHRPTQRRQWHWLLAVSTGMTGYIHWCDQSSIYLFWQIACGRPPAGLRTGAKAK